MLLEAGDQPGDKRRCRAVLRHRHKRGHPCSGIGRSGDTVVPGDRPWQDGRTAGLLRHWKRNGPGAVGAGRPACCWIPISSDSKEVLAAALSSRMRGPLLRPGSLCFGTVTAGCYWRLIRRPGAECIRRKQNASSAPLLMDLGAGVSGIPELCVNALAGCRPAPAELRPCHALRAINCGACPFRRWPIPGRMLADQTGRHPLVRTACSRVKQMHLRPPAAFLVITTAASNRVRSDGGLLST